MCVNTSPVAAADSTKSGSAAPGARTLPATPDIVSRTAARTIRIPRVTHARSFQQHEVAVDRRGELVLTQLARQAGGIGRPFDALVFVSGTHMRGGQCKEIPRR